MTRKKGKMTFRQNWAKVRVVMMIRVEGDKVMRRDYWVRFSELVACYRSM